MSEIVVFDDQGLVPCVAQDWSTGEVLTLAYMNAEALRLTLDTREVHFYSRSRAEAVAQGRDLGQRDAPAAAALRLRRRRAVALVEPAGPGVPHGRAHLLLPRPRGRARARRRTRRWRRSSAPSRERRDERPEGSYTAELLADPDRIGDKVREEADEVARAAAGESDERLAEEAADVLYHLEVLMQSRELPLAAALEVLNERRR